MEYSGRFTLVTVSEAHGYVMPRHCLTTCTTEPNVGGRFEIRFMNCKSQAHY